MKLAWMPIAKTAFEELRKRANEAGKHDEFVQAHNEVVLALRDFDTAFVKGELLFNTRKAGGEVRLWVNRIICVCYAVFREEQAGWILKYKAMPDEWPD
jgi:hypothetical protein